MAAKKDRLLIALTAHFGAAPVNDTSTGTAPAPVVRTLVFGAAPAPVHTVVATTTGEKTKLELDGADWKIPLSKKDKLWRGIAIAGLLVALFVVYQGYQHSWVQRTWAYGMSFLWEDVPVAIPPAPTSTPPAGTTPPTSTPPTGGAGGTGTGAPTVTPALSPLGDKMKARLEAQLNVAEAALVAAQTAKSNADTRVTTLEASKLEFVAQNAWSAENENALTALKGIAASATGMVTIAQKQVELIESQIYRLPFGGSDMAVVTAIEASGAQNALQMKAFQQELVTLNQKIDKLTGTVAEVQTAVNTASTQAQADAKKILDELARVTAAVASLEKKVDSHFAKLFGEMLKMQVPVDKIDAVNSTLNKLLVHAETNKTKPVELRFVENSLTAIKDRLEADAKAREAAATAAAAQPAQVVTQPATCYPQYRNNRFCR